MTKHRRPRNIVTAGPVTITRPDGTVEERPALTLKEMWQRLDREKKQRPTGKRRYRRKPQAGYEQEDRPKGPGSLVSDPPGPIERDSASADTVH